MKLKTTTSKPAHIKIKGYYSYKIKVNRQKIIIKNSIEIIKVAIDTILCPHCLKTIYIIHNLKNKKPLPIYLYCPNCNSKIFSKLIIAENQRKRRYKI